MGSRRSLVAGLGAVALLATPTLAAVPPAARTVVRPVLGTGNVLELPGYLRQGLSPKQALLARQADLLVRGGVSRTTVLAAAAHSGLAEDDSSSTVIIIVIGPTSSLEPVGDLDGNGVRDVVETRYGKQASDGSTPMLLVVRDGRTGRAQWSRRINTPKAHFIFPSALALGAGKPGLLLTDFGFGGKGSTFETKVALTGLDRLGKALWTHRESGTAEFTDSGLDRHHYPEVLGTAHLSGAADDVLISRTDSTSGNTSESGAMTPLRLNAAKGVVSAVGAPVKDDAGVPTLTTVGDLTGDHLDDIAAVSPSNGAGRVDVRAGKDGRAVWSATGLTLHPGAWAMPVGDVHAPPGKPAVAEVAVSSGTPPPVAPVELGLPGPDPTTMPSHGQVVLLDGATGTTVWSKTGDMPYAVGTAGASHVPATGVVTAETTSTASTTTETVTLATYDDAGNQVYVQKYSVSTPTSSEPGAPPFGFGVAFAVGDFEPDRSRDGMAVMVVASGNGFASKAILLRGVDGAQHVDASAEPLGGSTTTHGEDIVHVGTGHGVTVDVRRGSDDRRLFLRTLPGTTGMNDVYAYAAVQRGRCADVIVLGDGKSRGVVGVLASNGQVRWSISYAHGDLHPGTIVRPKTPPAPRCS